VARTEESQVDEDGRLFADLYPSLRRFAAVVGSIDTDPDDLLQEAVAQVLRRRTLTSLDNPGAYLRRTIVNLASNQRRGFAVRRKALARLGVGSGPERDVYPSDATDVLQLPARERAVLWLTEVEGYRYAEVGRMLGCSEAAARKRAMRARRRLYAGLVGEATDG